MLNIGTKVKIISGRFEGFTGEITDYWEGTTKGKICKGYEITNEKGEWKDAEESRVKKQESSYYVSENAVDTIRNWNFYKEDGKVKASYMFGHNCRETSWIDKEEKIAKSLPKFVKTKLTELLAD